MPESSKKATDTQRVWVTGASGMLGQAVVSALRARGHHVLPSGREADITDWRALVAFAERHRPTHLINCAAYTQVDASETQPDKAFATNAEGPTLLGGLAQEKGIVSAHVSTDYVFDGRARTPLRETDATAPKSVYGQSKLKGEEGFLAATQSCNLGYVVRTSWLFGPGGNNFVATMMRLMASRPSLEVVDDQWGRPTVTWDLAAAILDLMGLGSQAPSSAGLYHFANQEAVSWHGLASAVLDALVAQNGPVVCREINRTTSDKFVRPAPRPAYSVFDTTKITGALGHAPQPFRPALFHYVQENQAHTEMTS